MFKNIEVVSKGLNVESAYNEENLGNCKIGECIEQFNGRATRNRERAKKLRRKMGQGKVGVVDYINVGLVGSAEYEREWVDCKNSRKDIGYVIKSNKGIIGNKYNTAIEAYRDLKKMITNDQLLLGIDEEYKVCGIYYGETYYIHRWNKIRESERTVYAKQNYNNRIVPIYEYLFYGLSAV